MKWLGFAVVLQEHVTEGVSLRNRREQTVKVLLLYTPGSARCSFQVLFLRCPSTHPSANTATVEFPVGEFSTVYGTVFPRYRPEFLI